LRVEKIGYETVLKAIEPDAREPSLQVTLAAETRPRGAVVIEAEAPDEVFVDGIDTGFVAPTLAIPVGVGAHAIELRGADGVAVSSLHVNVRRGETVHL